jgi:hypothetical protein
MALPPLSRTGQEAFQPGVSGGMSAARTWATEMEQRDVQLNAGKADATALATETAARIAGEAALGLRIDAAEALAAAGVVPALSEVAAGQTTTLPANTYANGTDGVGATITGDANGALATSYFDSIAALSGTPRVWVRLEGAKNGLYVVTTVGDGSNPFVLTRATDADTAAELGACNFSIAAGGATLAGRRYQCQQKAGEITVGTTALTFALLNDDSAIVTELANGRLGQASLSAAMTEISVRAIPAWVAALSGGKIPICQVDLTNQRIWYRGRIIPFGDLMTDNGDGSFTFSEIPPGLATNDGSGIAVAVDYEFPENFVTGVNTPSGTMFSWNRAGTNSPRFEIDTYLGVGAGSVPPGDVYIARAYMTYNNNFFTGTVLYPDDTSTRRSEGVQRQIFNVPVTGAVRGLRGYGYQAVGSSVTGTFNSPTVIMVGKRALNSGSLIANCTVRQITIFDTDLTEAEIDEMGRFNERAAAPLFFYGDSLNNVGQMEAALRQLTRGLGYLPMWSDGKGSRGFSHHLARITDILSDHPKLAKAIPVLFEGGLDYSSLDYPGESTTTGPYSERDIQTYIRDIFALFDPSERVLMLPHTNLAAHTTGLAALNVSISHMRATWGPHVCDWQPLLQAQAADDASYLTLRANQQTPPALLSSGATDVHIKWPDGYRYAAKALLATLGAMGWPGRPRR